MAPLRFVNPPKIHLQKNDKDSFSSLLEKSSFQGYFWLISTSHQLKSEDDLRLFESWATETYFRRCEEEPQPITTQLENLKVWDRKQNMPQIEV